MPKLIQFIQPAAAFSRACSSITTRDEHSSQLLFLTPAVWPIGVARSPIPQDQRRAKQVSINGVVVTLSVALCDRPVNHFQPETFSQFWNGNGGRADQRQAHNIFVGVRRV